AAGAAADPERPTPFSNRPEFVPEACVSPAAEAPRTPVPVPSHRSRRTDRQAGRKSYRPKSALRAPRSSLGHHTPGKEIRRHGNSAMLDTLRALWADPGGDESAPGMTFFIDAGLFIDKKIVHLDALPFHSGYFADTHNFPAATHQSLGLDDQMNGAGNLL